MTWLEQQEAEARPANGTALGPESAADTRAWPEPLAPEAFHGPAGEFVRAVADFSEADPVGILASALILFGNAVGRSAFVQVGPDKHAANTNLILVGPSGSGGRKGMATSTARYPLGRSPAFSSWTANCLQSGLSSGEGLVWAVRDEIRRRDPVKESGRVIGYEEVVADPGIKDKRVVFIESEFASVLKVAAREGNTLSGVIRQAFDSGDLRLRTKNNPAQASGAHISIIGHVTREELMRYMSTTEMGNGFANRYIWFSVRRSKSLPDGEAIPDAGLAPIVRKFEAALSFAQQAGEICRDEAASRIWRDVYPELTAERVGLLGAILSRAEVQVLRLSLIYALLDCSPVIRPEHLKAALALWEYAEVSVRHIFWDAVGDPDADSILTELRRKPGGLTRTEISALFGRNRSAPVIDRALSVVRTNGLAMPCAEESGGQPREVWRARLFS